MNINHAASSHRFRLTEVTANKFDEMRSLFLPIEIYVCIFIIFYVRYNVISNICADQLINVLSWIINENTNIILKILKLFSSNLQFVTLCYTSQRRAVGRPTRFFNVHARWTIDVYYHFIIQNKWTLGMINVKIVWYIISVSKYDYWMLYLFVSTQTPNLVSIHVTHFNQTVTSHRFLMSEVTSHYCRSKYLYACLNIFSLTLLGNEVEIYQR